MVISKTIDDTVTATVRKENDERAAKHVSSGKLSASMLGAPLQEQILKALGVPQKEVDDYTLRKFLRGNHVEDWIVQHIPDVIATQKAIEYRNAVGIIDALVDTASWDFNFGVIPLEVKSVANAKYKRIEQTKQADRSHKLQAGLYALAEGVEHYAICYVAADDYRIRVEIHKTADIKEEVDAIIDTFDAQLKSGIVPVFECKEAWQKNPRYAKFPAFLTLTEEEIVLKLEELQIKTTK
jgi:hypothetical protein